MIQSEPPCHAGGADTWHYRITDLAEQKAMRAAMSEHLACGGAPKPTIVDAGLVASELVTNALTHGEAGIAELTVRRTKDQLKIVVCQPRRTTGRLVLDGPMPDDQSRRGRGLAIVQAISDEVVETGDEAHRCVEASLAARPTGQPTE